MFRQILRKNPLLHSLVRKLHIMYNNVVKFSSRKALGKDIKDYLDSVDNNKPTIWFLCVPIHNNLGDFAQYVCIKKWLAESLPEYLLVEIPTIPIAYDYCGILDKLKKMISQNDIIVFQSGYTSSDLHPDEIVHRKIAREFLNNKIIFFPQTVKYSSEAEAKRTAEIYNRHANIVFMARDRVSYQMARKYFTNISVKMFPDVVTTLIGEKTYINEKVGITFCIRDDSEKNYSDTEIKDVFSDIMSENDDWTDTTLKKNEKCNVSLIEDKIELFSKHKITITDRFHGTILSLVASTPVIVLKTTDHKVTEGAEWFRTPFPDYIRVANNLEEAHAMAIDMLANNPDKIGEPYFKNNYYAKLKGEL